MNPYRDIPRCTACGPGTITYRQGDFLCAKCGRPAWISERLRELRAGTRTNATASGAWTPGLLRKKDAHLLV